MVKSRRVVDIHFKYDQYGEHNFYETDATDEELIDAIQKVLSYDGDILALKEHLRLRGRTFAVYVIDEHVFYKVEERKR